MLVLDASVVVDYLLAREPHAGRISARIREAGGAIAAPHLMDVEVAQVLRRFVLNGVLPAERAELALDHLAALPLHRYGHSALVRRAFDLRHNTTVYDAIYLALAEGLDAVLLTLDKGMTAVPGHEVTVELV